MLRTDRPSPHRSTKLGSLVNFLQFVIIMFGYFNFVATPEHLVKHLGIALVGSFVAETIAILYIIYKGTVTRGANALVWCSLGSVTGCLIAAWYLGMIVV